MTEKLSHTFGYQRVEPDEREALVRRVFRSVAPRYDRMNDLMSFGIHRLWKRRLVREAAPSAGQTIVDLAGGTGDVARALAGADRSVAILDPSIEMMSVGRRKGMANVTPVAGTGERMPLADGSVDTLTVAFGVRNMTHMELALEEAVRVLKPGGRFLCLEFSKPWALIRPFYNLYSFLVIPRLGALVAGEPEAYAYLVESIRRFPDQREMKGRMEAAGMIDVHYHDLSFGIAALHVGTKP